MHLLFGEFDREDLASAAKQLLDMGDELTYEIAREAISGASRELNQLKAAQAAADKKPTGNPFLTRLNGR